MTVIIEYVLMDNFALDFLISYCVSEIIFSKRWLCVLSALFGCVCALFFPLIPKDYVILYKIFTLFLCVLPLCIKKKLKRIAAVVALYVFFGAVFSGVIQLFLGGKVEYGISVTSGGKVALLCLGVLVALYLIKQTVGLIQSTIARRELCKTTVILSNKECKGYGFFDGGNKATYNGEGVCFLDRSLSTAVVTNPIGVMQIHTVNGVSVEDVYLIPCIEIYFAGEKHIYRNVKAVKTHRDFNGFQVLLSCGMKEETQDVGKVQKAHR